MFKKILFICLLSMGLAFICKAQRFASTTSIASDAFVATNFWPSGTLVYVVDQEIWRRTTQNWGVGAAFSSITSVPSGGTAISSNANEIIQNVAGTVQGQPELIYDATPENFIIGNHTLTNTNFNGSIIQGGGIDLLGTGEIRDAISMGLNHVLNAGGSGTVRWPVQLGEQHTFVQTTAGNLANSYAIGGFNNTVNGGDLNFRSSGFIGGNGNTMTNAVNETNSAMGLNLRSVTISNPVSETVYTNHLNLYNGVTPVAGAQTDHMLGVQSDGDVIRYLVNQVPVASAVPGAGQDGQVLEWDNTAGNWVYATPGGTAISSNPNEIIQNVSGTVQGQSQFLYTASSNNLDLGSGHVLTNTNRSDIVNIGTTNNYLGSGPVSDGTIIGDNNTVNIGGTGFLRWPTIIGRQHTLQSPQGTTDYAVIVGGFSSDIINNTINGSINSSIFGGQNCEITASGSHRTILGGSSCDILEGANFSAILSGQSNILAANTTHSAIIGGQGITPTATTHSVFMPKIAIGLGTSGGLATASTANRVLLRNTGSGFVNQANANVIPMASASPGVGQDGQVLQWDNTAGNWVYATPGGGGGAFWALSGTSNLTGATTIDAGSNALSFNVTSSSIRFIGIGTGTTANRLLLRNTGNGSLLQAAPNVIPMASTSPGAGQDGQVLQWDNTSTSWVYATPGGGGAFWALSGTSSIATSATIEATGTETIEIRNQDAANDRASILINEISTEKAVTIASQNATNDVSAIFQPASIAFDFGNPGSNSGGSLSMIDNAFNTGSLVYTDNGTTKIGIRYDAVYDFANLDDRSLVQKQHLENINLVAEISLTNSQLLSLNTTPVEAIPAPGAGQAILIIGQPYLSYDHVTSDFGPNDDILLQVGTTSYYRFLNALSGSVDSFTMGDVFPVTAVARTAIENQAVNITAETGNPTLGGGTAKVFITYRIVTL